MVAAIIIVCVLVLALVLIGIVQYAISLARRVSSLKEKGALLSSTAENTQATQQTTNN